MTPPTPSVVLTAGRIPAIVRNGVLPRRSVGNQVFISYVGDLHFAGSIARGLIDRFNSRQRTQSISDLAVATEFADQAVFDESMCKAAFGSPERQKMLAWLNEWAAQEKVARARLDKALKSVRDSVAPEPSRSAFKRKVRNGVLIPAGSGVPLAVVGHSRGAYTTAALLQEAAVHEFSKLISIMWRGKQCAVLSKSRTKSTLLGTVRAIVYVPAPTKREAHKWPDFARIIERCRSGYIKLLSWKVAFDRTETLTLIRRLDFRGIGSIKEALLEAVLPLIQLWSDYVRRQVDLRGSASCA